MAQPRKHFPRYGTAQRRGKEAAQPTEKLGSDPWFLKASRA